MTEYEPPPLRTTVKATLIAVLVAVVLLFTAVLPAEYGVDPTGVGGLVGFTNLQASASAGGNDTDAPPQDANKTTLLTYRASWTGRAEPPQETSGYTPEGGSTETTMDIAARGIVEVVFSLRWTDANETLGETTGPDTFRLNVTSPEGKTYEAVLGRNEPGAEGVARLRANVEDLPDPLLVEATSEEEAADRAEALRAPWNTGTGTWTIKIDCVEAQDSGNGGGLLGPGGLSDAGNDWTLTATATRMALDRAALTKVDIIRETVTLTLRSGEGLEYKLKMDEGDTIEYEWSEANDVRLIYDLHGEAEGSTTATSHRSGTASSDEGILDAPFTGNHGWYFENRSPDVAVVELDIRGVFETIGVV